MTPPPLAAEPQGQHDIQEPRLDNLLITLLSFHAGSGESPPHPLPTLNTTSWMMPVSVSQPTRLPMELQAPVCPSAFLKSAHGILTGGLDFRHQIRLLPLLPLNQPPLSCPASVSGTKKPSHKSDSSLTPLHNTSTLSSSKYHPVYF